MSQHPSSKHNADQSPQSRPRRDRPSGRAAAPERRSSAPSRPPRPRRPRRGPGRWLILAPIVTVVVLVGVLAGVNLATAPPPVQSSLFATGGAAPADPGTAPLSASAAAAVTTVPGRALASAGVPAGIGTPIRVVGHQAPLTSDGKPEVLFVGAEFCPFCAAERWPLVVALSRFGTFEGLRATHSATSDTYPDTPTISFYGSRYTSPYLSFVPVETATNQAVGQSYPPLQRLTAGQARTVSAFDRAPYTQQSGSIPFIDLGNRSIMVGAGFDPAILAGLTQGAVAASLKDPSSPVAQAIDGEANVLIKRLCALTGGHPAVCTSSAVR